MRLEITTSRRDTISDFQDQYIIPTMLFVDIETTGLSRKKNRIYCIGCTYLKESKTETRLYFTESKEDEFKILTSFLDFADKFETIVTFNGTNFDLPFIDEKCNRYGLVNPLLSKKNLDLFRRIKKLDSILGLSSYKQKNIEKFLGIYREDQYNGGQLISLYHTFEETKNSDLYHALYLHNFEDVQGMLPLYDMLAYEQLYEEIDHISKKYRNDAADCLRYCYEWELSYPLPKPVFVECEEWQLYVKDKMVQLSFHLHSGILHHYFPNYKDYYYLPLEDTIIHKDLGTYMDPEYRQKATKENCFLKKPCDYIDFPCKKANSYLRLAEKDQHQYLDLSTTNEDTHLEFINIFLKTIFKS